MKTFMVKERELIDYIESLGFEVEARRALIEAMLRQGADSCNLIQTNPHPLTHEDVYQILQACL